MKMRKAIKKIVALGTGTAMVGATMMGAMAADLANYPAPFIQDGQFNAMIVVGSSAAPADVVGAIDIAASLQYHMKQTSYVSSGSSGSTTVEGGAKIESSSKKVWYGIDLKSVKSTFTASDLSFLADGSITDTAGTSYTYKQYIRMPATGVAWGDPNSELDKGVAYLDFTSSGSNWTYEIQFPTAPNVTKLVNKKINIAGKEFTFSGVSTELTSSSLISYAAGLDQTFTAGDTTTVNVGGTDIDVEVIGVNTQSSTPTATVKVNGISKSVQESEQHDFDGVKVYIKDVFAYTAPVTSGAVRLFIGSDKYTFSDASAVTVGTDNTDIEGTNLHIAPSGTDKISKIEFAMDPYSIERPNGDSWQYIQEGDNIVDPLFGTYKLAFTGITPALESEDRTYIKFSPTGTTKMKLKFTNKDGNLYDLDMLNASRYSTTSNISTSLYISSRKLHTTTSADIADEEYVIIGQGGYSRILQFKKLTTAKSQIEMKDVGTTKTNTYTYTASGTGGTGTMTFPEGDYAFSVNTTDLDMRVTSNAQNYIWTKHGMKIEFANTAVKNKAIAYIRICEETDKNDATTTNAQTTNATCASGYTDYLNVSLTWDTTNTKLLVDKIWNLAGSFEQVGDGKDYTFITPYGTYMKYNTDDDNLQMYYYKDITAYDLSFAPVEGAIVASSTGDIETTTLSKIAVGAAKLDTEISNIAAQNLISVGGPCANTVSAALMDNPPVCWEGWVEGTAKIKLFEQANGNVAMMVAGAKEADTKRASYVVADFDQYEGFEGMEIEVTGTTMNDIAISAPVATTTTTTEEVTTTTTV